MSKRAADEICVAVGVEELRALQRVLMHGVDSVGRQGVDALVRAHVDVMDRIREMLSRPRRIGDRP